MNEGQKKRALGRGMKPRGNQRVKPQEERKEMTDRSTIEGQEKSIIETVLAAQEGNETPGNLEPENGENSLQNLENSEATVAQDAELEAALHESGDAEVEEEQPKGILVAHVQEQPKEFSGGAIAPAIIFAPEPPLPGQQSRRPIEGATLEMPELQPAQEEALGKAFRRFANEPSVGPQPDGTYRVPVFIPEGVFEPVNELAKDRGISVERWCNEFFQDALDLYFSPAGKR